MGFDDEVEYSERETLQILADHTSRVQVRRDLLRVPTDGHGHDSALGPHAERQTWRSCAEDPAARRSDDGRARATCWPLDGRGN